MMKMKLAVLLGCITVPVLPVLAGAASSPASGNVEEYFEASEWAPSVDHEGRLIYSRWDYIDRENGLGSRFWICYPGGRDPRAPHGNYPHGDSGHFKDEKEPPDFGISRIESDQLTILAGDPQDFRISKGVEPTRTSVGTPAVWNWKLIIPNYPAGFQLEQGKRQILVKLRRVAAEDEPSGVEFEYEANSCQPNPSPVVLIYRQWYCCAHYESMSV